MMDKIRKLPDRENSLRDTACFLARLEAGGLSPSEALVIDVMINFMYHVEVFLTNINDPGERMRKLSVFEIMNEIYYDKLKKDVNTTH